MAEETVKDEAAAAAPAEEAATEAAAAVPAPGGQQEAAPAEAPVAAPAETTESASTEATAESASTETATATETATETETETTTESPPSTSGLSAAAAPWADIVEQGDAVEEPASASSKAADAASAAAAEGELLHAAANISLIDRDVAGAPDLHAGALLVREAGCKLGEPETVAVTSFSALPIDDSVKKAIATVKGWPDMSKIQQIGLPLILKNPPRNLIGQAQAGTGKTGTFVIGMLGRITAEQTPSTPQGIILAVTQELCTQIAQEVNALGAEKGVTARRVMSHRSKSRTAADAPWKLNDGEDFMEQVVVGTPGMVKNYLKNCMGRKKRKPMIDASQCAVLVLDEADKMVQPPPYGFGEDVAEIRDMVLKKRKDAPTQLLLFSATFTEDVRQTARQFVGGHGNDEARYHEIALAKKDVTLDKVVNFFVMVGDDNERDVEKLYALKYAAIADIWESVAGENKGQSVIFCNTKDRVQRLADHLRGEGYQVGQIHGDMDKRERDTVLAEFKRGERKALVSTNVTSRGIDNPEVTLVINVDLPETRNKTADPENFVHRIGRSGRWTKKGASVSLIARSPAFPDLAHMKEIERALFANSDVQRPLIPVDDVSTIGDKIATMLNDINY